MPEFNLAEMSLNDLKALHKAVANAIETYEVRQKEAVRRELEQVARARGFNLAEVLDLPPPRGRRGRPAAEARPAAARPAKYRHPENPALSWSGRGRRPGWVTAALEAGRTLEELRSPG